MVWDNVGRGPEVMESVEPIGTLLFHETLQAVATVRRGPPDAESLNGAAGYILYGPVLPFRDGEIDAIETYVRGGGRLLLTIYEPGPAAPLLARMGVRISSRPLRDETATVRGHGLSIMAPAMTEGSIAEGLEPLALSVVYALWGPEGRTTNLVMTGPNAYEDQNQNGVHDEDTPRRPHAVAVLVRWGEGQALIVGDEAALANQSLVPGYNRAFARQVARWLAGLNP